MISDYDLFFTKGGSPVIALTDSYSNTDEIPVEANSYKESPKPSWAYFVLVTLAVKPSVATSLTLQIRSKYGSSWVYSSFGTGTLPTSLAPGALLVMLPVYPYPAYPNFNSRQAITSLVLYGKTTVSGATASVKARLMPFKV